MKNIKDVIIGVFAVIGFAAILTGFTNEALQEHTVPESHVWEMHISDEDGGRAMTINKVTGEVRKYQDGGILVGPNYRIMLESTTKKNKRDEKN